MTIEVLTKHGCVKCMSAKQKLKLLSLEYVERRATEGLLLEYGMLEANLPVFVIDGEAMSYPAAMKRVKNA